jgi:predicted GNAT family acetyltransferase
MPRETFCDPGKALSQMEPVISNNEASSQFEAVVDGKLAVLEYRLRPDAIVFTHAEVPAEQEGQGLGSALARFGLEYAQGKGLKVIPLCPFVAAYIQRHQEYLDLVPADRRAQLLAG